MFEPIALNPDSYPRAVLAEPPALFNDDQPTAVLPEDIHEVFHSTVAHRLVFSPVYEMRRTEIAREMLTGIINTIATP